MTMQYSKDNQQPIFDKKIVSLLCFLPILAVLMSRFGPPEKLDGKLYYTGEQAMQLFGRFSHLQMHAYFIVELFNPIDDIFWINKI